MATYKVLQDIESEDKLLGPFTLKQFIFLAVTLGIGFVEFKLITLTGLGVLRWPFIMAFGLPMIVFGFLAAPISREQPNDIWLLARLRYLVKPRKRIWDQDGISELVAINVPKKLDEYFSNGLSQTEVKSRLSALANTLDSRGWAVKNVDVNLYGQQGYAATSDNTQRLVDPGSLPNDVPAVDIHASDDILDADSNPVAHHLEQMVQASTQAHRQQVLEKVKNETQPTNTESTDYWFMNQPQSPAKEQAGYSSFDQTAVIHPGTQNQAISRQASAEEQALAAQLEANQKVADTYSSHLKNIAPVHDLHAGSAGPGQAISPGPQSASQSADDKGQTAPNPAILGLASNDDLNVATIARQAKEITKGDDEVVISLH